MAARGPRKGGSLSTTVVQASPAAAGPLLPELLEAPLPELLARAREVVEDPELPAAPLPELLARAREVVEDPELPTLRRWRERGGRVLGHFQVYFPEELAEAAGLLSFKVRGAPVEPRHADSRFGSYLCSILKTSLETALAGTAPLDLFVASPICDAARNLVAVWGRNLPYPCHLLVLPQNPGSAHAAVHLRGEYARILAVIEEVAGRRVGEPDLRAACAVLEENRRLLRALYALRRDRPWLLAVDESWPLVALGGLLPRAEHNAVLRRALALLGERAERPKDKLRVVWVGGFCEQPPLDLLQMVARSCYVVDDDLLVGLRWLTAPVEPGDDCLGALARAYVAGSAWSPVQHDERKPKEAMLLRMVRDSRADAAILTAAKMCEPGLEDQVGFAAALDGQGIPYFVSEFEEGMSSFEHLALQLETFVESLLFD